LAGGFHRAVEAPWHMDMVNEQLIARCLREEPKAQYELYRALHPQMMAICSRYERNKQDAVARMNQGFLKILTNLNKRRPEVPFELWTRRILINTVIDDYRQQRTRKEQETLDTPMEEATSAEANEYLKHMEADAFAALLQQVPDMSRKVFNLFALDGYPHAEIAQQLGISEGTSKWHVSHARQVLQQAIAKQARAATIKTALS
jgi:RNA polymerase sigma factor (sigma-70 family)